MNTNSAPIGRDAFFARLQSPQTQGVDIGGGETVSVRKLSQADVENMKRTYVRPEKQAEGYRYVVLQCAVNAAGERLFNDEDMSRLAAVDFETIEKIALAALTFSGVLKPEKKPEPAAD